MRRVAVVGSGGAGKSTFARELGRRTGLPVVHLDHHFWKPGWVESTKPEWAQWQAERFAEARWIADGNYGGTFDVRFERADTVVVLAYSRVVCAAGVLRRWFSHHGRPIQADGCPERFKIDFLAWVWRYPTDSRPRLDRALERHRDSLTVIELRNRRAAREFLDAVGQHGGMP